MVGAQNRGNKQHLYPYFRGFLDIFWVFDF